MAENGELRVTSCRGGGSVYSFEGDRTMKLVTIGSLGLSVTLLALLSTAACSSSSSDTPAANDAAVPDTSPSNDDAGSNEACTSGPPPAGLRQMVSGAK